ncbi:MAG: enoyl-[acyl-carrier-protein] reductase FabK [Clostridiales bacterium]|nr:enoyl-[acyl-carrier-protein] reductase FabK [Clostridiales bacterium]
MNTRVTERLGIRQPVFQGGMAWVSDAKLAAAVSNGGGLGLISAMSAGADYLRGQIRACREMTDAPFGVNIMLMSPHAAEVARVAAEERVPVVTTGAGNPSAYMKAWMEAGVRVVPVIPSVALAMRMERMGATAVVAEGCEAGGHIGELTTMALIPQVADAVKIPVIAAGGIVDGRGMAAALMLGAEGVQCGTRFLCAEECGISDAYKQKVLSARDIDTQVTGRRLGHPVRSLKSPFVREFAELEARADVTNEELERFGGGALRRAAVEGDAEHGCFMAGQGAGLVKRIMPAAQIIAEIVGEAERLLTEGCKWAR